MRAAFNFPQFSHKENLILFTSGRAKWQPSGRLDRLLQRLAEDLRDRGKLDRSEAFIDATFADRKKGARSLTNSDPSDRAVSALIQNERQSWPLS